MSDRQIELSAPTSGVESGHSGSTISTRSALSAATHGVPLGANVPSTPSGGPTCTFTDHKISRSCGTDLEQDQPLMESMDKEEEEDFRSVNEDDDGEDQREGGGESEDEDESEDWYLGESEGWYEDESEDDESEDDEGLPSPSSNTTSESSFSLWNGYLRPGQYTESKTHFEATIIRDLGGGKIAAGNRSDKLYKYREARASSFEALHEISWTDEDDPEKKIDTEQVLDETGKGGGYGYVRHLAPGDRIAIHATALPSPGWANHVRAVEIRPPQFSGSAQGQSSMDDDNTNEGAEEEEGDFPDEEPESGENAGEEGWATTEDDETDSDGEDDSDDESDSSQDESEEETTDENGDVYEGYHKDDQLPEFSIGGPPMNPLDHPRAPEHSCPFWTEQEIEPLIPGKAHPHIPTSVEVKRVQDMLSIFFATELVKLILDEAGYWPTLTCSTGASLRKVEAWYNPTLTRYRATYCYYITPRLPSPTDGVLFKVRKIVFRLCSHDQGWTTDAIKSPELAYWGAKTWFEAAIIRGLPGEEPIAHPDDVARRINGVSTQRESNAEPSALDNATPDEAFQVPNPWRSDSKIWHLQRNVRAEWAESLHEVTWTDEDDPDKKENTKENLDLRGRGGAMGSSVSCNQGTGSPFTLELGMVAG
ncbi:hypothetical protein MD484_g4247, partial [Candolleomyces efflorescens]